MPPTSQQSKSLDEIAASLLADRGLELVSCKTVQSLWAGYGHICRVQARLSGAKKEKEEEEPLSLVLKYISPPATKKRDDEGHLRKILSYQVEQHFYAHLAPRLSGFGGDGGGDDDGVTVAECLGSVHDGATTALLLRDLQREVPSAYQPCFEQSSSASAVTAEPEQETVKAAAPPFPLALEKRGVLTPDLVGAALDWLAGFHGFFWRDEEKTRYYKDAEHLVPPPLEFAAAASQARSNSGNGGAPAVVHGVWQNGGYTYLATRRSEYASLEEDDDSEWSEALCCQSSSFSSSSSGDRSVAEQAAYYVSPAHPAAGPYATLIHGDVKSENMFGRSGSSSAAARVAFFDFQYVGLGLGVCDLAKLFTCSVPVSMLVSSRSVPSSLDMQEGEWALLKRYLARLEAVSGKKYPWDVFVAHWEAALVDWLRFQASWGFWGNTEWLEARVRDILSRGKAETWGEP
ncbi:hypothetical protein PG993_008349 [Apiospora rasikravindrae]|uniref:Aminoglycoside phosphotransferase domain-containing protein n=1 Tax=Apiospora rasikravindrae TaxID=990691 RepID=A0ABR1T026_9PEZI